MQHLPVYPGSVCVFVALIKSFVAFKVYINVFKNVWFSEAGVGADAEAERERVCKS